MPTDEHTAYVYMHKQTAYMYIYIHTHVYTVRVMLFGQADLRVVSRLSQSHTHGQVCRYMSTLAHTGMQT